MFRDKIGPSPGWFISITDWVYITDYLKRSLSRSMSCILENVYGDGKLSGNVVSTP